MLLTAPGNLLLFAECPAHQCTEDTLALRDGGHLLQRELSKAQLTWDQGVHGQLPGGTVPCRGHLHRHRAETKQERKRIFNEARCILTENNTKETQRNSKWEYTWPGFVCLSRWWAQELLYLLWHNRRDGMSTDWKCIVSCVQWGCTYTHSPAVCRMTPALCLNGPCQLCSFLFQASCFLAVRKKRKYSSKAPKTPVAISYLCSLWNFSLGMK